MNNTKQIYPCNLLQVVGLLFGTILLFIPIFFFATQKKLFNSENFRIIFGTLFYVALCLVPYIVNKKRGITLTFSYKLGKKFPLLAFSIVLVLLFQLGVSPIITSVFRVFSNSAMHLENPLSYTYFKLISIILIAPAIEEMLFRGIILNGFLSNYSSSKAIIFSALLFGAIHLVPSSICVATILGLLLGWIYYQTKSLLYTTIVHIAANIFGLLAVYFRLITKSHTGVFDFYGHYTWYVLLSCLTICVFSFVFLYRKKYLKHETIKNSDFLEVFQGQLWESEKIIALLEVNNVEAFIKNEHMSLIAPWYITSGGANATSVIVLNENYDLAIKLIEELFSPNRISNDIASANKKL